MSPIGSAPRRAARSRGGRPGPARPVVRRVRASRRYLACAALLGGVILVTTGCQDNAFTRQGLPAPVTRQGQVTLTLWRGSWIAAWCVGFVVWGMILWAVIVHRKRSDRVPQQVRYNLPIEILYTVVPFIMVGVLFYFTARDEDYIDKISHPNLVVDVTGFQWSWRFDYPQYKVPGSESGDVTEIGQMWNGEVPGNKNQLPLLEIPRGENIEFNLASTDVIHSFWIVPFNFKRDVLPDHPNHFEVTPTSTGSWVGRCSELCGLFHSRMLFNVKIVTQQQFHQWISQQQAQQLAQARAPGGAQ